MVWICMYIWYVRQYVCIYGMYVSMYVYGMDVYVKVSSSNHIDLLTAMVESNDMHGACSCVPHIMVSL